MNRELVDKVVHAVLYEGYILYPYRASSKKNQRERFTFGRVYPKQYSAAQSDREPCSCRPNASYAMNRMTYRWK
jgi:hypothetical protein